MKNAANTANNNAQFHLLLVDDDSLVAETLRFILPTHWKLTWCKDPEQLDGRMMVHAAFVDMHLTGNLEHAEGPSVISKLGQENPLIELVAISGDLSLDLMEECLARGAKRFIAKPLSTDEVISALEKIEAMWVLRQIESQGTKSSFRWIGTSQASEKVKNQIAQLRGESGPLLIEGETGTGKEVVFRLLNQQELGRPFIAVNMAGIPETLFESELFGHVKGAFTGADSNKIGLAEAAHGGDLFLDEIEALSLPLQAKLLRFLETGEVRKVGSKDATFVKCRVIAATNKDLSVMVKNQDFREDLLFRLSGKKINLPALRERTEDITEIANYFLSLLKPRTNKSLHPEALALLKQYAFPGNVRELRRICEQVALVSPLPIIRAEDLRPILNPSAAIAGDRTKLSELFSQDQGLARMTEQFEYSVIQEYLKTETDPEKVAKRLKISRSTLYKKIKDYEESSRQWN